MTYSGGAEMPGLNEVLAGVVRYPVTSGELVARAKAIQAAPDVIDFFESIPGEIEFTDEADILSRREEITMIIAEESFQPEETLHSYD